MSIHGAYINIDGLVVLGKSSYLLDSLFNKKLYITGIYLPGTVLHALQISS